MSANYVGLLKQEADYVTYLDHTVAGVEDNNDIHKSSETIVVGGRQILDGG